MGKKKCINFQIFLQCLNFHWYKYSFDVGNERTKQKSHTVHLKNSYKLLKYLILSCSLGFHIRKLLIKICFPDTDKS